MKNSIRPTLHHEKNAWQQYEYVIGIDEVGRGCMAGPITVGGVCLNKLSEEQIELWESAGLNDSKKLSAAKRIALKPFIETHACCFAVQCIDVDIINSEGIVPAFEKAVHMVIEKICASIDKSKTLVYIDGFTSSTLQLSQKAIIKGDQHAISIAAASIIAKVHRDNLMEKIGLQDMYKMYDWGTNKGYGTLKHREAIKAYGPTKLHRTLYIRNIVGTS